MIKKKKKVDKETINETKIVDANKKTIVVLVDF